MKNKKIFMAILLGFLTFFENAHIFAKGKIFNVPHESDVLYKTFDSVSGKVLLGINVLENQDFKPLKGKRIGLVTNHTGVNREGKSTVDILYAAPDVKLIALFSPEHGIRGKEEHGKEILDTKDTKTGLPIFSLYGKTKRPTDEMLKDLDVLVFDIQDIGTRFYTYITTLAYVLEEAAKRNIELFVLDRPNPLTGVIMEGEILTPEIKHFTAYLQVPVRHGMTIGEIANWYNRTSGLNARLTVVKMEGWKRGMWWDDTGLDFHPTSPNIHNLNAAILYSGIGGFEATNVSVGRGTKKPFEILGAPWIEEKILADRLNFYGLPGFKIKPVRFTPKNDLYKGELCKGIKITLTDRKVARPVDLFIRTILILMELYPENFVVRWDEMERVIGSKNITGMLKMKQSPEQILLLMREKSAGFEQSRKPYLLYN